MFTKQNVEDRLCEPLRYKGYVVPDASLISKLEHLGVDATQINGLDDITKEHFAFCWAQKGFFAGATRNAVEIAYCLGVRPIYVAMLIQVHGFDWQDKLWVKRRHLPKIDAYRLFEYRGTIWTIETLKILHRINSPLRILAEHKGYDAVVEYVSKNRGCLLTYLVDDDRVPLFNDKYNPITSKPAHLRGFSLGNSRVYAGVEPADLTSVRDINLM